MAIRTTLCCLEGVTARAAAAVFLARPRLHLDEYQRPAGARDDVDFAVPRTISSFKNCVPPAGQFITGEIFPNFPEGLTAIRHHARGHPQTAGRGF